MEIVAENLKVPAGGSAEEQLVAQQKMTNMYASSPFKRPRQPHHDGHHQ